MTEHGSEIDHAGDASPRQGQAVGEMTVGEMDDADRGARRRNPLRRVTDAPLVERVLAPFYRFAKLEAAGGIVLLLCTVVALAWANSPWADAYHHLWEQELTASFGGVAARASLHALVNDGLMAVFFFLVGLEIKREVLVGELASPRQAALPVAGALGGMLVPAAIYAAVNGGGPGARGWGVPMATDIAFALGVLALLGKRVPTSLKVFLAALAIADDIGAVLVIAIFYTGGVAWGPIGAAAALLVASLALNAAGARRPGTYAVIGAALWVAVLLSGVHATVAGVLLAFTIPVRTRVNEAEFLHHGRAALDDFDRALDPASPPVGTTVLTNARSQEALHRLERLCEQAQPPLHRLEYGLHGVVAFAIMPLFALANAGVSLSGGDVATATASPVALGVVLGLVLGKPVGIVLFSVGAARLGLATMPRDFSRRALVGVGILGGIGFTMALFVAGLAFAAQPALLAIAKVGVLAGSTVAGVAGALVLRTVPVVARRADDAA
jgi:NhaA family Na+:H+ antiporter